LNDLIVKNNDFFGGSIGLYLDGPSKFVIDRNIFGREGPGKGMDHGIMTINAGSEFNFAQCNKFVEVCYPIEASGENSGFSFLGNEFNGAITDVIVSGTNTNPGTVRFQQGNDDDTPNNCFGSGIDIETIGVTEWFQYFIPDNSNAPTCLFPDIDGNNYTVSEGFSDLDICGQVEFIPKPPFSFSDLESARKEIDRLEEILSVNSKDQSALSILNKWNEIKDVELRWLINDLVEKKKFKDAELIADTESLTTAKKLKYSIRLAEKNYNGALKMLLTIPAKDKEDIDFVTTQLIFIESMTSKIPFKLTNTQIKTLNEIKEGTTSSRGTADVLLWRYDFENYNDNLKNILTPYTCGPGLTECEISNENFEAGVTPPFGNKVFAGATWSTTTCEEVSINFDFGDGTTYTQTSSSGIMSQSHIYEFCGEYEVCLEIVQFCPRENCSMTYCDLVTIQNDFCITPENILKKSKSSKQFNIGNFPNPFNQETTISFHLDTKQEVSLSIYDLQGKVVKQLFDRELHEAGNHSIVFKTNNLLNGTYICILKGVEFSESLKLVKIE